MVDGAKGILSVVRKVFGQHKIQRMRGRPEKKEDQQRYTTGLQKAYRPTCEKANAALAVIHDELTGTHPEAARSLQEGM